MAGSLPTIKDRGPSVAGVGPAAEEANAARSSAATHMQAAARRRAACTSVSQMRAAEVEAAAAQAAAAMAKRVEAAVRMQAAARRRAAGKYTCFIFPAGFFDSPRTGSGERAGEGAAAAVGVSDAEKISNAVGSGGSSVGVSPAGSAAPQGSAAISLPPAKEAVSASPDAKAEAAPARVSWADEVEEAEGAGGEGAAATGFSGTEQNCSGAHSAGGTNVAVSPAGSASQHERRPILLPPAQATTPVASGSVEVAAALAWQRASEADAAHRSLRIYREVKTEAARVVRVFRLEAAIKAAEKAAEVAKAAEAAAAAADAEAAAIEEALADLDPTSAAAEEVMAAAMEAMERAEAAEADGEAAAAEAMANDEPETVRWLVAAGMPVKFVRAAATARAAAAAAAKSASGSAATEPAAGKAKRRRKKKKSKGESAGDLPAEQGQQGGTGSGGGEAAESSGKGEPRASGKVTESAAAAWWAKMARAARRQRAMDVHAAYFRLCGDLEMRALGETFLWDQSRQSGYSAKIFDAKKAEIIRKLEDEHEVTIKVVAAVGPRKGELIHALDPYWKSASALARKEREKRERATYQAYLDEMEEEERAQDAYGRAAFGAFMANCGREDGDVAAATMAELGLELDAAAGPAAGAW